MHVHISLCIPKNNRVDGSHRSSTLNFLRTLSTLYTEHKKLLLLLLGFFVCLFFEIREGISA